MRKFLASVVVLVVLVLNAPALVSGIVGRPPSGPAPRAECGPRPPRGGALPDWCKVR